MTDEEIVALPDTFPADAFWAKVDRSGAHWLWTGRLNCGYGLVMHKRRSYRVHRVAWFLSGRSIPSGLVLDHLCRVRHCVNPDHLEPVTDRVNTLRGIGPTATNAAKDRCPVGHPLKGQNLLVQEKAGVPYRRCRACALQRTQEWRARNRKPPKVRTKTHCPHGHAYDEANTYVSPSGKRMCKTCRRTASARHRSAA